MKFAHIPYVCILCLCATVSFCQQGNLLFHHINLEDGLTELTNSYAYKDSRGFVWITSINGLNRFDGVHIKTYTHDPGDSNSILGQIVERNFIEDKAGFMWLCTFEAINVYDPKQDTFGHYQLKDSTNNPIQGYQIFYMDPDENLWIVV